MNMMKIALLGTAALVAVSVSARAENLNDLKAQIEALNAQVAATADAPAAASTSVVWSGNVAAGIVYTNTSVAGTDTTDIRTKWGLGVTGKTDTAVGEVGASIAFAGGDAASPTLWYHNRGTVNSDGYSGWWKITPAMTLFASNNASLSGNGQGFDAKAVSVFAEPTGGGFATFDPVSQIGLAYADGPIAAAIAVEDGDNNKIGFAGEVKYSGDSFSAEVNGGSNSGAWAANVGVGFNMDMFGISVAGGMGSGTGAADDYTKVSGILTAKLGDTMSAEIGAAQIWNTQVAGSDATVIGGGIYYTPVSQLRIGVEAGYTNNETAADVSTAALITKFSF